MSRQARFARRIAAWALLLLGAPAGAADFPAPLGLGGAGVVWPENAGPFQLIEHGIPPLEGGVSFATSQTEWYGLPELTTRALAAGLGGRGWNAALGFSLTGTDALGWRTLGVGMGGVTGAAGVALALRVRDEPYRILGPGHAPWSGLERSIAGGAWARLAPAARMVVSTPRLWADPGELPHSPAQAALLLGEGALSLGAAWRQAQDGPSESAGALRLARPPLLLVAGVRTAPLRSGVGLSARWGGVALSAGVELHPVLGTTGCVALESGRW